MAPDPAVYNTAYATASKLGASSKVLQSLFEAGLVESGFTNHLTATDHDSLGYLQQRPSTGWGTPAQVTNVVYATNSYVKKAMAYEASHPNATAGQIAQAIQQSAFPARYDQQSSNAAALLAKVDPDLANDPSLQQQIAAGLAAIIPGGAALSANVAGGADPVSTLTSVLGPLVEFFGDIGRVFETILPVMQTVGKLFLPSNLIRIVMGVFGAVFCIASVWFLGRELKA